MTRDLDLFFRGLSTLGSIPDEIRARLSMAGMSVTTLRTTPMFAQLNVSDTEASIVVDLVSDPNPFAEAPESLALDDVSILVETAHQLLVNKLCALLSRSELRDLVDVRELLANGGDLHRALTDCPKQDAGFSPLTFSWAMTGLHLDPLGKAVGMTDNEITELIRFRDDLVDRVVAAAKP